MCQFDTPNFIYYSYAVVFALSLITAFSILYRDIKHPVNRDAFFVVFFMALWIISDLAQWVVHNVAWNLFFARLTVLFSFIFLFFLYFSFEFTRRRFSFREKIVYAIPFFAIFPFVFTDLNVWTRDAGSCDFIEGPLFFYSYIVNAIYACFSTKILFEKYKDLATPHQVRSQIRILIIALWFAWIWITFFEEIFRISMLRGSAIDISPYFVVGILFFISLIAFAIIKSDLFNFNTVPTETFSIIIWSAIFMSLLFFQENILSMLISAILYVILLLIFWKF